MDRKQGFEFAKENGYIPAHGEFYKLFKSITRLKSLTSSEKIVLAVIMSYTTTGQEFYMSNNRLALETGMGYATAIRCITDMKNKGFLKTYRIKNEKGFVIGRTAVPQKQFMAQELEKSFEGYTYEEY